MYLVYIGTWYISFQMIENFKSNFVISEPQPCGHRAFKIVVNFICIYPSSYLAVSCQLQPVAMVWLPVYWLLAGSGYWLVAGTQLFRMAGWLAQRRMTSPLELFQPLSQCGRTVTAGNVVLRTGQDSGCLSQSHGLGGQGQQDT